MRTVVTMTTDFGTRDGYVAQMKGVVLGINPDVRIVDVTHDISPYSIMEAALVLKGIAPYFPPGTVHLAVVDPGVGGTRRGIVVESRGRWYVGPDNGLFSLLLTDQHPWEIREIENQAYLGPEPHPTFHGRDIFAPVAAHVSTGVPFETLGRLVEDPVRLAIPDVVRLTDGLKGQVIHIDRFGNLTSNIDSAMIDRPVAKVAVGAVEIEGLSRCYAEVEEGAPVALINSFGYLEIAVNRGNAARSLGVSKEEEITLRYRSS